MPDATPHRKAAREHAERATGLLEPGTGLVWPGDVAEAAVHAQLATYHATCDLADAVLAAGLHLAKP